MIQVVEPTYISKEIHGAFAIDENILGQILHVSEQYIPMEIVQEWGNRNRTKNIIITTKDGVRYIAELDESNLLNELDKFPIHLKDMDRIEFNRSLSSQSISLWYSNKFHYIKYIISHEKSKLIEMQIKNIITGSKTWYSFFYNQWMVSIWGVVAFFCFASIFFTGISITIKSNLLKKETFICILILPFFTLALMFFLSYLFPSLCFHFGIEGARLKNLKARRQWVAAAIGTLVALLVGITTIMKNLKLMP